jgi:hypothetical protein
MVVKRLAIQVDTHKAAQTGLWKAKIKQSISWEHHVIFHFQKTLPTLTEVTHFLNIHHHNLLQMTTAFSIK